MKATMTRDVQVTMKGQPVQLEGEAVSVGDVAPAFTAVGSDLQPVTCPPMDVEGKATMIVAVPSLDTSVCSKEAHRFDQEAQKTKDLLTIVISMDLPFAQKRWCDENEANNILPLSDYRDASFGRSYGVLIKDVHLLARSIFVVGKDGRIKYIQIVNEVTDSPDFEEALAAARAAATE